MPSKTKVSIYIYQTDKNGREITIDPKKYLTIDEAIEILKEFKEIE